MSLHDDFSSSNANIRFGNAAGYTLNGDLVQMDAELRHIPAFCQQNLQLGLQLWAEAADHTAIKLGEALLAPLCADENGVATIHLQTAALPPAGGESYQIAMRLVAHGEQGSQVIDQFDFARRQVFIQPQITGHVSAQQTGDTLSVHVAGVCNPRASDNQSGTLALELWALPTDYRGGAFAGLLLARQELAPLAGQATQGEVHLELAADTLPAAPQHLVLMLREWSAVGYLTRDYRALLIAEAPAQVAVEVTEQAAPVAAEAVAEIVAEERAPVAAEVAAAVEIAPTSKSTAKTPASPAEKHDDKLVSINHASAAELAKVKGLNLRLAESIITGRPWAKLEALVAVKGIGEKTLARLRKHLQL